MYNQNVQLSDAYDVSRMVKRGIVVKNISIFAGVAAVFVGISAVVTSVVYKLGSNIWSILVAISVGFAVAAIAGFSVYFPIRAAKRQEDGALISFRENVQASQYVQHYNSLPCVPTYNQTNLVYPNFSQRQIESNDLEWMKASYLINGEYDNKFSDYKKSLCSTFKHMVRDGYQIRFDESISTQNSCTVSNSHKNNFNHQIFAQNISILHDIVNENSCSIDAQQCEWIVTHLYEILNSIVASVNYGFNMRKLITDARRTNSYKGDSPCQNVINDFIQIMPIKPDCRSTLLSRAVESDDIRNRSQLNVTISQKMVKGKEQLNDFSCEQFGPKFEEAIEFFANLLIFHDKMCKADLSARSLENIILDKGRDGKQQVASIMTHSSAQPMCYPSCSVVPSAPSQ